MNRILTTICSLLLAFSAVGQIKVQNAIFGDAFEAAMAQGAFKPGSDWMPYPAYSDRQAWESIGGEYRETVMELAEKAMKYEWKPILASTYLEYEKTGNRALMKDNYDSRKHIVALAAAELLEGKGRFISHMVDGLWMLSQQYSWSHAQHTRYQSSKRTLPMDGERPITLHSSNLGSTMAYVLYFFKEEFDKMDPSIALSIKEALKKNVLDPYLDPRMKQWWQGDVEGVASLNNWSPYCTSNVVTVFLLCEEDPKRLEKALRQSVRTMDLYMNNIPSDGACDEGPSYWDMSTGKVYDYAKVMYDASRGRMDVLKSDLMCRMGEFKSKTYFGDGYVMNFADGKCRDLGDLIMMFRYAKDTGSKELADFAIAQLAVQSNKTFKAPVGLTYMFRVLETLRYAPALHKAQQDALAEYGGDFRKMKKGLISGIGSVWYDQTECAILRKGKWTLAAKAGNNGERHNHNDVGCGILYVNSRPVIVDPGVGTYVKDTFGPNRYTIWNNSSQWHSVPVINGQAQVKGKEHAAAGASCDIERAVFSADISGAYPENASCLMWNRTWTLSDGELVLTDRYELSRRTAPDVENIIVRGDVVLPGNVTQGGYKVRKGEIVITAYSFTKKSSETLIMTYPDGMTPSLTERDLTDDIRMEKSWGKTLTRITFTSKAKAPLKGQYEFRIKPFEN